MISITTKELEIENDLKRKIQFICDFCNTKPTIINGSIRNIDKSNLSYVESHRIIIKGITFLAFYYSKTLYVGNLSNKLELKDLETFIIELNKNNYLITNDEINELEYKLDFANDTIDELEDKVSKLEEMLEYFKNLWKRFIKFLQNKFFSTDKYDNIIQDLYNEDMLDNDDIDIIQNNKSKNEEIER